MVISIYSERFEDYAGLFDRFTGMDFEARNIKCDTDDFGIVEKSDLVIADPRLLEKNNRILDLCEDKRIVISGPFNTNAIVKEIEGALPAILNPVSEDEDCRQVLYSDLDECVNISGAEAADARKEVSYSDGVALRVGIVGMGHGAGASYVTMLLAEEMAAESIRDGSVTVASIGNSFYYDALGMDRRFAGKKFVDIESVHEEYKVARKPVNMDDGISWAVSSPQSARRRMSASERSRILYRLKGDVILWDIGYDVFCQDMSDVIRDIDMLIFVIDPLPSKMLAEYETFTRVRGCDIPVVFVINRMNEGVNRHELMNFLKIRKPVMIPYADPQCVYSSQYSCENPYRNDTLRKISSDAVGNIIDAISDIAGSLVQ